MIILFDDAVRIPLEVVEDFNAFRRWTKSKDFPHRGEYAFLGGDLWTAVTMETLLHNKLKLQITSVLALMVVEALKLGHFFSDRMRLVHEAINLSTEPDGMFATYESVRAGRVHWERGQESLEVIGSPDMVLEVVSTSSVQKDTVLLRELYAAAEIGEYWLVNPLQDQPTFDILRLSRGRYVATRKSAGWIKSAVFGKSFRLAAEESADDLPQFRLQVR